MEFASRKIFLETTLNAPFVFISEDDSRKTSVKAVGERVSNWIVWLANASIVRSVAPGQRSLQRYEFEDVAIRRGGFGNVL